MPPPLDPEAQHAAASLLWRHWQDGTVLDMLPAVCRPTSRAEGYALQARLPTVAGRTLVGWKIAATSLAGQAHINVGGPLAGRLLSGQVAGPGAQLSLRGNRMRVAEPEFSFRMACTLPPRARPYTTGETLDAVASVHPSIEIPDSRYADFVRVGEAQLLADNACAGQWVLGEATAFDWRTLDLAAHAVTGRVQTADGRRWQREGTGANVLGDPREALRWLVNELSSLGLPLEAGAVVSTGTCMAPLEVGPGDRVEADFGVLGRVSLSFEP